MGRLFWKFFFFFWLAQLVTAVGVGAAIWVLHPLHAPFDWHSEVDAAGPPPPPPPPAGQTGPPGHAHPHPHPAHQHSMLPPPLPIIAGCIVSLLFAALLAWYFARPIRALRSAFAAVAGGRLETRVGALMSDRRDEFADLGKEFDLMADRLQALLDSQRHLLHDVSHELRSPLARLQAAADLLRQQPERSAEFIDRIERDTARMDKLVGELLTLARLDGGTAGSLAEDVDLREIVGAVVEDAQIEAEGQGCSLAVTTPAGEAAAEFLVRGHPELLLRALENVVRNAVRHSPRDGKVAIALLAAAGGQELRVTVTDQGPGVAEGDLDAIFAPFFRSGPADAFAGYGLGLAIARRVVETHGGSIRADNRPEGGLLVTLSLPRAPRV